MASLTTSYLRPDEMDPFGNPRRAPFAAPPMPPDGGAMQPPASEDLPPKPPIAGALTPAELAPKFQADVSAMNRTPDKPPSIYDDPQFADYMAEQAGPKPDKTARVLDAIFSGLAGKDYDARFWDAKDQEAKQEQLRDINSPQSKSLRQSHAPLLRQIGFTDDEIAHMSGADITGMTKGGNLVEGAMRARQSAAQAKAAEAKLAEQRAYAEAQDAKKHERDRAEKEADLAKQHEYEQAQIEPRFARQKELAAIAAGGASARQIQGLVIGDELQRQRAEEAAARDAARREAEKKADEQRKIAAEQRTVAQKEADEVVALKGLKAKLEKRDKADRLPGQRNVVREALSSAEGKLLGEGAGLSPEDASLHTDLTALGLQSYMNTAHNAPNSAREQEVANSMFRGNGTVGSALDRVNQRIAVLEKTRSEREKAGGTNGGGDKQPAPAGGMVRVRDPKSGAVRDIPAANAAAARARGLEVIGGG